MGGMTKSGVVSSRCPCARCARPESFTGTAAPLAVALTGTVGRFVQARDQNLGHVEAPVAAPARELLRQAAETGAQQKAEATPPRCPHCGPPLEPA